MGGRKKLRDPNAPKRPLTGYMRYCQDNRDRCSGSVTDTGKQLGQRWKKLTDSQKAKYNDSAKKDWAKWAQQWAKYKKTDSYAQHREAARKALAKKKRAARRPPKDENRPKRAMSAFMWFMVQTRGKKTLAATAKAWKVLKNKTKWEKMATDDKAKEKVAMEKYKKSTSYKNHVKAVKAFKDALPPTDAAKAKAKARAVAKRTRDRAVKKARKERAKAKAKAKRERETARRAARKEREAKKKAAARNKKKAARAKKKTAASKKKKSKARKRVKAKRASKKRTATKSKSRVAKRAKRRTSKRKAKRRVSRRKASRK